MSYVSRVNSILRHHFAKYCFNLDNKFKNKNFETRYLFKIV